MQDDNDDNTKLKMTSFKIVPFPSFKDNSSIYLKKGKEIIARKINKSNRVENKTAKRVNDSVEMKPL